MNDGSTQEKQNAEEQERYCFDSESPNLDLCRITYLLSPSPLGACRCACVAGILKKMKVFQDYLYQHRDLISLVAKIVLATGKFLFFIF